MRENDWEFSDGADGDLAAISVTRRGVRERWVWICTLGRAPRRYYYDCDEWIDGNAENGGRTVDRGHDVGFDDLVAAMIRHLNREPTVMG